MESEDSIVPTWKQGWVLADDDTWYWGLPDGTFAKDEWVYAGGSWYLMDADGSTLTGKVLKDGVWYYLTSSGAMATGWVQDATGAWYFASTDASDGRLQTGWQKSNGSWYWLDPATSKMTMGWFEQGGSTYYLSAPNGNMLASAWVDDENGHHWLGSDGALLATVSGNRIVYADASHAPASGLTTIGDAVYYADPETGLLKGGEIACEDGKVREFDESTYAAVPKWYTDEDGTGTISRTVSMPQTGSSSVAPGTTLIPRPALCSLAGRKSVAPGTGLSPGAAWGRAGSTTRAPGTTSVVPAPW